MIPLGVFLSLVLGGAVAYLLLRPAKAPESDADVAGMFWLSMRQACEHEFRFGSSERMWARMSAYEEELKKRGFSPVKVWHEVASAKMTGRALNLDKCRADSSPSFWKPLGQCAPMTPEEKETPPKD
jgi:hypothetical protein